MTRQIGKSVVSNRHLCTISIIACVLQDNMANISLLKIFQNIISTPHLMTTPSSP